MRKDKIEKCLNSEGESDNASSSDNEHDDEATIIPCPENIIALDCEMVGVGKAKRSSLARCSIVDYHGKILFDKYIQPKGKITDFRTRWSGIRPEHMKNTIPFAVARKQILKVLKNKIIVGHALNFDMKILKIRRQCHQLRDTSKYGLLRVMAGFVEKHVPSLKNLSKALLYRDIQYPTHCSIEDSMAAMDLYRIVETEWEKPKKKESKSLYFDDSFWPDWLHM